MWLVVVNVGSALQKKDPLEISQKFLPHWEIFFLKPKKKICQCGKRNDGLANIS